MTRLRDEIVRAIYMPDIKLAKQRKDRGSKINSDGEGVGRTGTQPLEMEGGYFRRTPYFRSGIRTVSDQEFLREVEAKIKGLEKQVSGLQTKVTHST